MTSSEQARADAVPYRCLDCEMDISAKTRWWHQHEGHHTLGPLARGPADSYQARADAMADAATFEIISAQTQSKTPAWSQGWLDTYTIGLAARRYCEDGNTFWAAQKATLAAHAAFRAVPGLRG